MRGKQTLGYLIATAIAMALPANLAAQDSPFSQQDPDPLAALSDQAMAVYNDQGTEAAEPLFRALAQEARRLLGPDDPDAILATSNHAFMLLSLNRFAEAEPLYAEVEKRSRAVMGDKDPGTLQALNDHALVLEKMGRHAEAEPLYREAYNGRIEVLGERDPATILSLNNYALILMTRGRYAEAEPLMAKALQLHRDVHGSNHADTLLVLNNYAYILSLLGRPKEAEPLLVEAVEASRTRFGPRHVQTLKVMGTLGDVLRQNGKVQEAFAVAGQVLELSTELLGREDPFTLVSVNNYATLMSALGLASKAEPVLAKAITISRRVNGEKHPDTLRLINNYASVLSALDKQEESTDQYELVLRLRREVQGDRHPETINAINNYGQQLVSQGRLAEAKPFLLEAYSLARDVLGERHPSTLLQANNYAGLLRATDHPREAFDIYRKALPISREVQGDLHPDTLRLMSNLAFALEDIGEYPAAAQLYIDALQGRRKVFGDMHPDTLDSFVAYAELLEQIGQPEKAEGYMLDSLNLRRKLQGDRHPATLNHAANLASLYLTSTDTPEKALASAELVAAGTRARDEALGGTPQGDAQLARDRNSRTYNFQLLADASWSAAQAGANDTDSSRANAFAALQDVLAGSASRAIAQSAARRAAEQAGGLGELARERQDLADQWLAVERQLTVSFAESGPAAEAKRGNLQAQLQAIEARTAEIDSQLRTQAPDYFALIRPQSLDESSARALMRPDEAAVMLVPTRFGTHVMAITAQGVTWHRSAWTDDRVKDAVTRLLWDVGANVDVDFAKAANWAEEGEGAYPYDFSTAAALYRELLEPQEAALVGKSHVFVMASGSLSALPLGLLVSNIPEGASGDPSTLRSADWLADRFALLQVPSLQSIRFLRDFRAGPADAKHLPFLGFGDPVLGAATDMRGARGRRSGGKVQAGFRTLFGPEQTRGGKGIADISQLNALASLPGTAVELTEIWEAFGKPDDALYLAKRASESAVRSVDLDAEVIAFATHGILAGEIGGTAEPGLVLTPPERASADNDGYLSMSEIAGLKMDADWVILSACNTAAGDGSEGASGLSGLARAFFYAGARNLLASYWPVRDDVAARLTVRTVEIARTNPALTRAQAFQQAMREIRNDSSADSENDTWAHPNAWAPFVFVGDR
ncbi:tetratricopeptide repeat protein [Parasphingorhabdus sp.]|uniref:tetratricopeptide repeat protein n=1 Tax=Parasphingorhabdus sp. TaxID=2709688 RepID=UPI003A9021DA